MVISPRQYCKFQSLDAGIRSTLRDGKRWARWKMCAHALFISTAPSTITIMPITRRKAAEASLRSPTHSTSPTSSKRRRIRYPSPSPSALNERPGSASTQPASKQILTSSAIPDIEDTPTPPTSIQARNVTKILQDTYPYTSAHKTRPILDSLIATILSQATSRPNSTRAFQNLTSKFPTWEDALAAGPSAIQTAIHCAGLSKSKATTIHSLLTRLSATQGHCSMEYIRSLSDDDAKAQLCDFKGVGPKTAACVLMFAMSRKEFPVDTHVRRITARLGWMPLKSTPEQTYQVLNKTLPNDIKYPLHVLLIEHGRKTCKARIPRCSQCSLVHICPARGVLDADNKPHDSH